MGSNFTYFLAKSTETFDLNTCVNYRNKTFYVGLHTCMSPAPPISTLYKLHVCTKGAGIATCYVLDGPGVESQWRETFRTRRERPWRPPSFLYDGRDVGNPAPKYAEVKERVERHFYSTSGPSWLVLG
jgi:hypothetical protein